MLSVSIQKWHLAAQLGVLAPLRWSRATPAVSKLLGPHLDRNLPFLDGHYLSISLETAFAAAVPVSTMADFNSDLICCRY